MLAPLSPLPARLSAVPGPIIRLLFKVVIVQQVLYPVKRLYFQTRPWPGLGFLPLFRPHPDRGLQFLHLAELTGFIRSSRSSRSSSLSHPTYQPASTYPSLSLLPHRQLEGEQQQHGTAPQVSCSVLSCKGMRPPSSPLLYLRSRSVGE